MITETELRELITEHFNNLSREDFLDEVNWILDTTYTVEDIDWGTH